MRLEQPQKSQIILQEGLAVCERNNYTLLLTYYYINLSNIYTVNHNIPEAFALLERAHTLGQSENNQFIELASLLEIAQLLLSVQRYDDMTSYLKEADKLTREFSHPILTTLFYFLRGTSAYLNGDIYQLKQDYQHCFDIITPQNPDTVPHVMNLLLYITLLLTLHNDDMTLSTNLLKGVDAYSNQMQVGYTDLQINWRNQISSSLKIRGDDQSVINTLDIQALMKQAQSALTTLPNTIS